MDHRKLFFLTFAKFLSSLLQKKLKFCKFQAYEQQYGEKVVVGHEEMRFR